MLRHTFPVYMIFGMKLYSWTDRIGTMRLRVARANSRWSEVEQGLQRIRCADLMEVSYYDQETHNQGVDYSLVELEVS